MAGIQTYIIDDQDPSIQYLCPVSRQKSVKGYYRNTWTSIAASSCSDGWFSHTFNGTQIRISSPFRHPTTYAVRLDDGPRQEQMGNGIYQSPVLPDGQHTVTYYLGNATVYPAFDYLTVTSGPSTSLVGRTIVADDRDSSVKMTGSWSATPPASVVYDYSSIPYRNTTQWSSTLDDSISFRFRGSSVAAYGVLPKPVANTNFSVSFSIDNQLTLITHQNNTVNQTLPLSELFRADFAAEEDVEHTLFIKVLDITGPTAFGLDFIAYNASTPRAAVAPSSALGSGSSKAPLGAIIGGTLGGLFGLALLVLLFFFWRKRTQHIKHARSQRKVDWIEVKTTKVTSPPYILPTYSEDIDKKPMYLV